MKRFAVVFAATAFTLIAIALFNGPAPASDTKQQSGEYPDADAERPRSDGYDPCRAVLISSDDGNLGPA